MVSLVKLTVKRSAPYMVVALGVNSPLLTKLPMNFQNPNSWVAAEYGYES